MNKEAIVKLIKSRKWMVQGFNGLPLYLHTVASNTGWMLKPITGVNYSHFFLRSNRTQAKYYYDEKDLLAIGNGYYKKIKSIPRLKKFVRQHRENYYKHKKIAAHIPAALNKLPMKELVPVAQKIARELTMAIGVTHAIEGISFVSEQKIHKMLDKRGKNSHENFQLLSSPTAPSFLSQAQTALWEINQAQGAKQTTLIKKFLSDFGWLDNSYVEAKTLTAKLVLQKARRQKHLPSAGQLIKTGRDKARLIKSLKLNKQEKFVIRTVDVCSKWQDDRKKFLLQTISWFEPVIHELSQRTGLDIETFKFAHSRELTYKNLTDKKFLRQLKARLPQSDFYALKDKILVFSGSDAKYIESRLNNIGKNNTSELKGMVANKGWAKGRVRICHSIYDIPKFKKGEILVASMTRPEHLPAMQKAAAFITDEGGITSHASIVSRELNIPCIIGTKIATEILHDGDLVEIDANHGTVKILKR